MDVKKRGDAVTEKELKIVLLDMMDYVHSFCKKENIDYFLLGGSMLGAVRHKGFIPWDDDIDIGMKRVDYEKFCKEFYDAKGIYEVKSVDNDPNYYLPAAKVIDKRISLIEYVPDAPELGAYIDVFPLDFVELDNNRHCSFFNYSFRRKIESLKFIKIDNKRAFWKNFLILSSRILCRKSLHEIATYMEEQAKLVSCKTDTGWLANLHGAWGEREIVRSEWFGVGAPYEFEGRIFTGPVDYDNYLKSLYGDYMTPPPLEKRVTHHGFFARWK